MESVYSTTTDGEKGVLIPGVYFKDGYLLFAHQFFRRTLSILNSTNEEFFVSFEKLRDIPNLNVKVALDMDMVGLPGTEHPEIEYQYIRGPYFSEDLKLIPEGVTCYEMNIMTIFFRTLWEHNFIGISKMELELLNVRNYVIEKMFHLTVEILCFGGVDMFIAC